MREVKYGHIVGGDYHRAELWVGEKEIGFAHVDNWDEAVKWAQSAWKKRKSEVGEDEVSRLGWTKPELRYWL